MSVRDRGRGAGSMLATLMSTVLCCITLAVLWAAPASASEFGQVTLDIDDVGELILQGATSNSQLGGSGLASVGDVNGDEIDDIAASAVGSGSAAANVRGINVIYTPTDTATSINLLDLQPSQGYRIRPAATIPDLGVANAGDQNSDGVDDFLLTTSTALMVIYGVAADDVGDLPLCGGTGVSANISTRCLDIPAAAADPFLPATGGFKVTGVFPTVISAGDFDGDGKDELAVDGLTSCVCSHVIPNASEMTIPASGVIDASAELPAGALTVHGVDAGPLFTKFGSVRFIGDVNGDEKDDVAFTASTLGDEDGMSHTFVLYGSTLTGDLDAGAIAAGQGLRYDYGSPDDFVAAGGTPIGLDGLGTDGRPGLAVPGAGIDASFATTSFASIIRPPADGNAFGPRKLWPAVEGGGYLVKEGADVPEGSLNYGPGVVGLGDLDGNGIDEFAMSLGTDTVDGNANAGRVTTFFTKTSVSDGEVTWDADMPGSTGFTITGGAGFRIGNKVADIGDIDGDGLSDMAVSGQPASGSTLGALYLVRTGEFMAGAKTGGATVINDKKAALVGIANSSGRDVTAHFEYGTDENYGSATADQPFDAASGNSLVEAGLEGLAPATTYHYRLAVTNDLGLTRYGADRTFTTEATQPLQGCDADPTKPGCDKYCEANPTAPSCPGYVYCDDVAHAGEPGCQEPVARLSGLIVNPQATKVKRGKKTTVKVSVVNTGNDVANAVKICASGPKKLVNVRRSCVTLGSIAAGSTKTAKFTVAVKRRAKRGGKAGISISATAAGLDGRSAKVTVRVR